MVLDDVRICLCRFTFSYGTCHSLLLAEYWDQALLMTIRSLCVFLTVCIIRTNKVALTIARNQLQINRQCSW